MNEILKRAKKGDKEAFTELIILIEKDLYKIARMRIFSEDDINDAVQNTIIKVYNSLKKLKNDKYFKTWTIKILINECNNIYSDKLKKNSLEYEDNILEIESLDNINDKIDELDFKILIRNLNYNERIAIILYYLEDFSAKEIGKILNESESTITTRISRARNKLKKVLEVRNNE